jgi:hypothetical protein
MKMPLDDTIVSRQYGAHFCWETGRRTGASKVCKETRRGVGVKMSVNGLQVFCKGFHKRLTLPFPQIGNLLNLNPVLSPTLWTPDC